MNKFHLKNGLSWLSKLYQQIRKDIANIPAYAIIEIQSKDHRPIVDINILGTGNKLTCSPRDITSDEDFLKGFAMKDIRTLLYLDYKDQYKPRYQMIGHKIAGQNNDIMICFKHRDTGKKQELMAIELIKDTGYLTQFSPEDAYKIGYLYASVRP